MSGVKRAHASKERKDDEGNSDVINPIKRHKSEITGMQKCTSGRRRGRSLFFGLHAWAWNMIEGLPAVSGHQRWVGFQNPWISHFYQISAPFTKWKTNAAEISTLGLMLSQRNWIHNQICCEISSPPTCTITLCSCGMSRRPRRIASDAWKVASLWA